MRVTDLDVCPTGPRLKPPNGPPPKWCPGNTTQDTQMLMLVWLFAQATGVTDCQTILAGAQTMACIPRNLQLPALIWQMNQIVQNGGIAGASVFQGNYGGNPPLFTPIVIGASIAGAGQTAAIAYDTGTGEIWAYYNGIWQ